MRRIGVGPAAQAAVDAVCGAGGEGARRRSPVAPAAVAERRITDFVRWLKWTIGQPWSRAWRASRPSGLTATGWPTACEHRQVARRVAVGVALGEVEPVPAGDLLASPSTLPGAVAERAGELAGVDAVDDRAARADARGHAERLGERLDDLDRRRRHDVGVAAGVAVQVEQAAGLRADLGQQLRAAISALSATRSSWRMPLTAPRMRSRTPSVVLVARPAQLERAARRRRRARTGGSAPGRPSAPCGPRMNADEPAISVRSRSKNAALGPAPTIRAVLARWPATPARSSARASRSSSVLTGSSSRASGDRRR